VIRPVGLGGDTIDCEVLALARSGFHLGRYDLRSNAVSNWFPIHVGDKWVYEHLSRIDNGGGQAHPDVHTWKTEEITIGSWTVPEGTVVGRQVRVIEGAPLSDAALSPRQHSRPPRVRRI
jgi:hypothetical protein